MIQNCIIKGFKTYAAEDSNYANNRSKIPLATSYTNSQQQNDKYVTGFAITDSCIFNPDSNGAEVFPDCYGPFFLVAIFMV
ncbi:MAG: hypothetical protein R3C28_03455 [Pirellulaceae bacterium]